MDFEEALDEVYNDVGGWYLKVVFLLVTLFLVQVIASKWQLVNFWRLHIVD